MRITDRRAMSFVAAALLFTNALYAQVPWLETDRPDQTETPVLVLPGCLQVETGWNYEHAADGSENLVLPVMLARYGVNQKFELRLELEHVRAKGKGLLLPATVGFKSSFLDEGEYLPITSAIFHVGIPAFASSALRGGHLQPSFRITMAKGLGGNFTAGVNAGAEWDGASPRATGIYTAALGYDISDFWYAYAEVYGDVPEGGTVTALLDAGVAFAPLAHLQYDASAGVDPGNTSAWYAAFGCSFRLPR